MTPDGQCAISGSYDDTLKVWDLESGSELFTLRGHTNWVNEVAVTPDRQRAVSASQDNTLKLWDLNSGAELLTLRGHTEQVNAVAVTSDGRRAVSASRDQTVKVWDLERGTLIVNFSGDGVLTCCAVAPDGVTIVAGEASGRLHFLRLEALDKL